jgi:hypothetical protein
MNYHQLKAKHQKDYDELSKKQSIRKTMTSFLKLKACFTPFQIINSRKDWKN